MRCKQNAVSDEITIEGLMQSFKADAVHHGQRVNDVPQGLGHLAAVSIAHHAVEVHLLERYLACKHRTSAAGLGEAQGLMSSMAAM